MNDTAGSGALGINADELMGEAIAAERSGDRTRALELFALLVEMRPHHEQAWMWIARLSGDPVQKIDALKTILQLNPDNQTAQLFLASLNQQQRQANREFLALAEEHFQRGQKALKAKDKPEALGCFAQAVELNPDHGLAWQQLGEHAIQVSDQIAAFKNVVRLRPKDAKARQRLRQLVRLQKDPLALGRHYTQRRLPLLALEAYQNAASTARSDIIRLEAQRLLEDAQIRREIPSYRGVNPWFTLARLSLGPMVLYAFLVLIQAGLNPLHVSPLLCPSGILVIGGSILLAALHDRATRVVWLRLYGHRLGEKYLVAWFSILGFAMLLFPFLFVLFDSLLRLRSMGL